VIPENIHTLPLVASWNSEEEGGFLDQNSDGMGVLHSLKFQMHREGLASKEATSSPGNADMSTFLV